MLEFKSVEIKDREWIKPLLDMSDYNGCGYSFGNIFSWQRRYKVKVARVEDALVIKSGDDDDFSFAYPAGKFDIKHVFGIMKGYSELKNVPFSVYGATEEQISLIEESFPGQYEFIEDRSFFDYIYSSENLIKLAGKKFHGKRNHISRFNRTFRWSYEAVTDANLQECRKMAEKWFDLSAEKGNFEAEKEALSLAFEYFKELEYVGGLLRIDNEVVAFTLGEQLNSNTFCSHFEKALPQFSGAYTVINNEFAKNELSSYEYINREEDMGLEGLRKAKLSYYPDILLKKYVVRGK